MRKQITMILIRSMMLPLAACKQGETTVETTVETTTEVTQETSVSTSEEETTTTAPDTASYCESGLLKGLRIEENNTFVNTDEKYSELISQVNEAVAKFGFEGSMLIATDDEIIMYSGPKALSVTGDPVDPYTTYDHGNGDIPTDRRWQDIIG